MSDSASAFLRQPLSVWATAFATMVGFMGIGLVDPILNSIARGLDAGPGQVSLLFTSYFAVTASMMLVTGWVSSRIGGRATVLLGLALIVLFATLSGLSDSVWQLVAFRGGWGMGNALFVATALSVIVGASSGGSASAVLLYEAALGLGMSAGPLLGAALGHFSWRYPFFGTATLMAVGFVAISTLLEHQPLPRRKLRLTDPLRALAHRGLAATAVSAFAYNFGFFTVLAFTPFVLGLSPGATGAVFFGWGLLLAVFSVLVAPRLQIVIGSLPVVWSCLAVMAVLLLAIGFGDKSLTVTAIVASGAVMGMNNTVYTELALEVSSAPRAVASAGYNFVRWFAGVIAPYAAPKLAESYAVPVPFVLSAGLALAAAGILAVARGRFVHIDAHRRPAATPGTFPAGVAADGGAA